MQDALLWALGENEDTEWPFGEIRRVDRFRVDRPATKVIDDVLTDIESTTRCQRYVTLERLVADYLAGPSIGRHS